ncbi:conserved hypothetical protein [Xenorhabdus nematophila F1]|uniref:Uncharacterized protein n=1 Tax=Xenorhabdus nematophila (strain ATCC 19061 / DSM 3370 / CCUG 14189 / LMG 1036 / NCIMB 9965 / AN6) TaxID=406817 RepID=D3VEN5_XENNA|nr:hypothetical protein D3790_07705 [Xenorhabdus nematophila]CBJ90147.1 hypothetical protein XNC1_2087 [Xenorhabdus nematophila ATCC 19061]CCW32126.1 conserved hypothetical protein [Xenorhabdus nematophila F1]CEE93844.1 hypothetical protein XNA1_4380015 [Xenorhabdus nematophila str. Anatoliense]CEF32558.1 hypothetical protein XNW1_4380021 [Xenorhabdus nematophila str. Websteri]CEK23011.1 hypothetical protein XNC2_2017 [Xenorhabdus nematophila AN6/1]
MFSLLLGKGHGGCRIYGKGQLSRWLQIVNCCGWIYVRLSELFPIDFYCGEQAADLEIKGMLLLNIHEVSSWFYISCWLL